LILHQKFNQLIIMHVYVALLKI